MVKNGIRWEQRFSHYLKALTLLQRFIDKGKLSDLEEQGLVKAFECSFDLALSTIKDFLESKGEIGILSQSIERLRVSLVIMFKKMSKRS